MSSSDLRPPVTAVLGPTNTGKTHLALERMLGHRTGMIGFPLRLLARENYDRVVKQKGAAAVALVTGEERIIPATARYFVCTVESMPLDRPVEFLAIDEIQLISDGERGHVFTERLLGARGQSETMLLGAETAKPIIRRLVPRTEFITRPRFSSLTYSGAKKLTRLPPRSAVVAFSAAEVYALAEQMRRQRGGCAVVLGALSPRARNAQVGLYQAGEVDYMVATDAIGMGLNMDLDHVAFARLTKFDGEKPRCLTAPEIAQIAGRAGRHMNDGTFGTTADEPGIAPDLVEAIEAHRFDPLGHAMWRNPDLDFRSLAQLQRSLDLPPPAHELRRKRHADDHQALLHLARNEEIAGRARRYDAVRLLWDVCQVPDFRKTMADGHTRLLSQIYLHLSAGGAILPTDWVASQIARVDRTDGDIDQLSQRIAHVRTWTYVSHRPDWLADAAHWQERTRAIEDRLSDALHERLTQRFVDRRGAALVRRLKDSNQLLAGVTRTGEVVVEGHEVGRLDGFVFLPDATEDGEAARAVRSAARRALASEIAARVRALLQSKDGDLAVTQEGRVLWREAEIGRLVAGSHLLTPMVEPLASDLLTPEAHDKLRQHLTGWAARHVATELASLFRLRRDMPSFDGPARGLAYELAEGMGSLPRSSGGAALKALTPADRKQLGRIGVRFGTEAIFLEPLLRSRPVALRALLYAVRHRLKLVPPAPQGASIPYDPGLPIGFYAACGYRRLGPRVVRLDRLERLAALVRGLARSGPFPATAALIEAAGCAPGEVAAMLVALGYRAKQGEAGVTFVPKVRARQRPEPREGAADSPFAALRDHRLARP
jgi:ATP-dependent RNA helicase SUPV3L1/SUV3